MASRCRLCDRARKSGQPVCLHEIHGTTYTVHAACRDLLNLGRKEAEKRWDFRKLKPKQI